MVAMGVARLVGVVVGRSGSADLLFKARESDPVDANVAVHPDVPAYGLVVALHKQVHDLFVRPKVAGVGNGDLGVCTGKLLALMPDTFLKDTSEEEIGEDDDASGAQSLESFQPLGDVRGSHADVRGLHHRIRAS